jgi:hypothetical protein
MRDKDINIINDKLDIIIDKALVKKHQLVEPYVDEYVKVKSIIMDFIKNKKRIIYGGHAWNELIKSKSPSDAFYKENARVDVEFYSNNPIEDIVKLCNILYSKNFKYIQGKSAQHKDTYNIFVNFEQYCDISYMPSNVFHACMTETVNGFKLIHPKFILVDILRQFNDPILSYWRMEKTVRRGKTLMNIFPLELYTNNRYYQNKINNQIINLIQFLIEELNKIKSIMFMGNIAYNTYTNPTVNIYDQITTYDNTPIEVISTRLKDDVFLIYNLILKFYIDSRKLDKIEDKLTLDQYYPFFQFTDKRVDYKYDGKVFLTVYGNNDICIPYNIIKLQINNMELKIKIGTFNLLFMFYLVKFHLGYLHNNKEEKQENDNAMYNLLVARNKFLDENNKTVLDQTIFEDFKPECMGLPVSSGRKMLLMRYNRKLTPKSYIQPYYPEDTKPYNTANYNFGNYSANIINNPLDKVYDLKK